LNDLDKKLELIQLDDDEINLKHEVIPTPQRRIVKILSKSKGEKIYWKEM
jgi:hypothetical protein